MKIIITENNNYQMSWFKNKKKKIWKNFKVFMRNGSILTVVVVGPGNTGVTSGGFC